MTKKQRWLHIIALPLLLVVLLLATRTTIMATGPYTPGLVSTDFEATDNFSLGACNGQNGWSSLHSGGVAGVISMANPAGGSQHMRNVNDPAMGEGSEVGCLSPTAARAFDYAAVDMVVSAQGGADYSMQLRRPGGVSVGQITFGWDRRIMVGSQLGMSDSGYYWTPGQYHHVVIDYSQGKVDYYLDGTLIASFRQWGGALPERVSLFSDNRHQGDVGDWDNLDVRFSGPNSVSMTHLGVDDAGSIPLVALAGFTLAAFMGGVVLAQRRT